MAASKYDLRAARAPRDARTGPRAPGTQVTGRPSAPPTCCASTSLSAKAAPSLRPPRKPRFLLAEARGGLQSQLPPELGVVAQFRVGVERQVVGEQVDVVREQQGQPLLHPAGDADVLAAPEQAVVHEDRVGPAARRLPRSAPGWR
jgi:hypothetical protein